MCNFVIGIKKFAYHFALSGLNLIAFLVAKNKLNQTDVV